MHKDKGAFPICIFIQESDFLLKRYLINKSVIVSVSFLFSIENFCSSSNPSYIKLKNSINSNERFKEMIQSQSNTFTKNLYCVSMT